MSADIAPSDHPLPDDASARAVVNLARVLFETGALSIDDIARAAERLEAEGHLMPDDEVERFEMIAHWLRCVCLPSRAERSPEAPRLDVIEGGKIG